MSIRDPLGWLKEHTPGEQYETITLRVQNALDDRKTYQVAGFNKRNRPSYGAVVDWLERSAIYIWPYAEAEHSTGDLKQVTLTLQIDCAPIEALYISGDDTLHYNLAEKVSRTLSALSDHVHHKTKGTIFIDIPK